MYVKEECIVEVPIRIQTKLWTQVRLRSGQSRSTYLYPLSGSDNCSTDENRLNLGAFICVWYIVMHMEIVKPHTTTE